MKCAAAAFGYFVLCASSWAWDPYGHMMVDSVAEAHLNPKAKAATQALAAELKFPGTTYTLVTIGCWMDDIRTDNAAVPFSGQFKTWHYINRTLKPDDHVPDDKLEPGSDNQEHGNVVQGLKRAIAVLQGGEDPYITSKAQALAMVCHLTGDIHQPLHCASGTVKNESGHVSSDSGGNRVIIDNSVPMVSPKGESKCNLHSFWDGAYRAGWNEKAEVVFEAEYHDFNKKDMDLLAKQMMGLEAVAPAAEVSLDTKVVEWMEDSNAVARDFAFGALDGEPQSRYRKVSADYVKKAQTLAKQRIVLAGYRLAKILNDTLGRP